MQANRIVITGGAGFIGSWLVDELVRQGEDVVVYDNLDPQVHVCGIPEYLNPSAEFIRADVRDRAALAQALKGARAVYHLAARVGVGQSNYDIREYMDANVGGMATLLDVVANEAKSVKRIIMTASMTSYGEGDYLCEQHGRVTPPLRSAASASQWEPLCPLGGEPITPVATQEREALNNNSVYALSKAVQESMLHLCGQLYGISTLSFRCFNVYGPRQSLSNPYTGVAAIFISRLKNGSRPVVYEDGEQTRDFISVHDVVECLASARREGGASGGRYNLGSGRATSIKDLAGRLAGLTASDLQPEVNQIFRANDIRHCIADISAAKAAFAWQPRVALDDGLQELINWSSHQSAEDHFEFAEAQLKEKGLLK